jgi:hypothetical protein
MGKSRKFRVGKCECAQFDYKRSFRNVAAHSYGAGVLRCAQWDLGVGTDIGMKGWSLGISVKLKSLEAPEPQQKRKRTASCKPRDVP